MKKTIILLLKLYKIFISTPLLVLFGLGCKYNKSCSDYAQEAIDKYGVINGGKRAIGRLSTCHSLSRYQPELEKI